MKRDSLRLILTPPTKLVFIGEGENSTIKELREALEAAQNDAKKYKEDLGRINGELEALKRSQMGDIERLQAEREDLAKQVRELTTKLESINPVVDRNKTLSEFISSQFESRINALPEDKRAGVRELAFVDGDPVASLSKLESAFKTFGLADINAGSITNPTKTDPSANPDSKLDPKKVNWSQALPKIDTGKTTQ